MPESDQTDHGDPGGPEKKPKQPSAGKHLEQVFLDLEPNWRKLGGPRDLAAEVKVLASEKARVLQERLLDLPPFIVRSGPHAPLLHEARQLYLYGFDYSCVTMCGVTAERIARDIMVSALYLHDAEKPFLLPKTAASQLEYLSAARVVRFIEEAGFISEGLKGTFHKLGRLRNRYAHGAGKESKNDARSALGFLHEIIDGTVAMFAD